MDEFAGKRIWRWMGGMAILLAPLSIWAAAEPDDPYVVRIDTRPWIEALRSDDLFVADPAIEALGELGDSVIPALEAAFSIENEQARLHIVEVLRDIRTPATVPLLGRAASDPQSDIRGDAIEALGKLADPAGREYIEAGLRDPDSTVQRKAVGACNRLCTSPAAVERLVELAIDRETNAYTRARQSLHQLMQRGKVDRASVQALSRRIALPVMNDPGAPNRDLAALMVATAGLPEALPNLIECATRHIDNQPMVSILCVQALGESGLDDAIPPLVELAAGDHRLLAPAACKALFTLAATNPKAKPAANHCAEQRKSQRPPDPRS